MRVCCMTTTTTFERERAYSKVGSYKGKVLVQGSLVGILFTF